MVDRVVRPPEEPQGLRLRDGQRVIAPGEVGQVRTAVVLQHPVSATVHTIAERKRLIFTCDPL